MNRSAAAMMTTSRSPEKTTSPQLVVHQTEFTVAQILTPASGPGADSGGGGGGVGRGGGGDRGGGGGSNPPNVSAFKKSSRSNNDGSNGDRSDDDDGNNSDMSNKDPCLSGRVPFDAGLAKMLAYHSLLSVSSKTKMNGIYTYYTVYIKHCVYRTV